MTPHTLAVARLPIGFRKHDDGTAFARLGEIVGLTLSAFWS